MIKNIPYIFLVFSLSSTRAIKQSCNKQDDLLQRCPMALPVLSSPETSFALTREELDKSCLELKVGIKCIDDYTEDCMEKQERAYFRKVYAGITEVVKELCSKGKYQDEYLKHADCVKNVRHEYEKCSKKYEVTLTSLSNNQLNSETDEDHANNVRVRTICCSFQEYLLCSERTVQASCGADAALFTSTFLNRMAFNIIKDSCLEYKELECGLAGKSSHIQCSSLVTLSLVLLQISIAYFNGYLNPA